MDNLIQTRTAKQNKTSSFKKQLTLIQPLKQKLIINKKPSPYHGLKRHAINPKNNSNKFQTTYNSSNEQDKIKIENNTNPTLTSTTLVLLGYI